MVKTRDQAAKIEEVATSFLKTVQWNNKLFCMFYPINQDIERKKLHVLEQKKTWVQANFEHVDPKFYRDWKAKLDKQGLLCAGCKQEFSSSPLVNCDAQDSDEEELKNVRLSDDQAFQLEELRVNQKKCAACSRIWQTFTQGMLEKYVEDAFSGFDCRHKIKIKTREPVSYDQIEIEVEIKPSFIVIDDDQPQSGVPDSEHGANNRLKPSLPGKPRDSTSRGKRVVYYNKII